MKKICVVGGNGKMGRLVVELLKNNNFEPIICDLKTPSLEDLFLKSSFDAIIDFSLPSSLESDLKVANQHKIPLLICCTGHNAAQLDLLNEMQHTNKIFVSYNLSEGIYHLKQAFKNLCFWKDSEISITDIHHKFKKDKPSGTTKELEQIANTFANKPVSTASIRQDNFVGIHKILISSSGEYIELSHTSTTREVYAKGALKALNFMLKVEKNGLYSVNDVFES